MATEKKDRLKKEADDEAKNKKKPGAKSDDETKPEVADEN